MKDRLSVHIDNGQSEVREAVTILRNGGTGSQSGLVGITNAAYSPEIESPYIPATIFNVQSTGDSNIRFSSGPSKDYRSSLELLGVGNNRASGLHFSYNPQFDDSFIDAYTGYGTYEPCVNPNSTDKTVADFSLIRPSGEEGMEFSHISLSERGYVSIGLTRVHEQRHFEANAPLTIAYMCDDHQDSGTISIHEQASSPTTHGGFGKLYVKPYSVGGRSQAIYFKDDTGNETNLVLSQDLDPANSIDGLVYGNQYGNTFGGHGTPGVRYENASHQKNTFYGYLTGSDLVTNPSDAGSVIDNILIGWSTGSGLKPPSSSNTVIGTRSLVGWSNSNLNVVVGRNSLLNTNTVSSAPIENTIIIGNSLWQNSQPSNGTLAIGHGSNPLLIGNVQSPNKFFTVSDGYFSVLDQNSSELKIRTSYDNVFERNTFNIDIIDYNENGSDYGNDNLKFNFINEDDLSLTLLHLDPRGGPLTNTPNYQSPASTTPYAQLDADLKLRGAIRFQDGTSLSGIADFEILPTFGDSGVNKVLQLSNNANYLVLDYSNLELAGNVSSDIRTDNTFIAVQLDGTNSSNIGKMSLQGLADYVSSGTASIAENCNILISNAENELRVNTGANARSVMIGCDVAYECSGQYNSIMIGSSAGSRATVSNPSLTTPFNNIFIGQSAGQDSNDTAYAICIGDSAGKNSDSAQDCIFLGNSAGLDSTQNKSIGIGKFALKGGTSDFEGGIGNIEINAGISDGDRLFSNPETLALNYRLSINKTIAGRTDRRNISIGDARLSPIAPLEVRRDSIIHAENENNYIQTWYCDDALVAYIDCNGNFVVDGEGVISTSVEGIMDDQITGGSMASPASGLMSVYIEGVDTGDNVYVVNRDATLTGIPPGTYVVGSKFGDGYRPSWVACF